MYLLSLMAVIIFKTLRGGCSFRDHPLSIYLGSGATRNTIWFTSVDKPSALRSIVTSKVPEQVLKIIYLILSIVVVSNVY